MSSLGEMAGQLSLHCGAMSLTLSSQGGACTALRWQAGSSGLVDLLQPRSQASQEHFEQPSFPLVPYSNRLFAGQLLTPAGALTLPCNHPRHPMPVHGLGWRAHLKTGALIRLLPRWFSDVGAVSLYYPSTKLLPAKTRAFVDFTIKAFRDQDFANKLRADR